MYMYDMATESPYLCHKESYPHRHTHTYIRTAGHKEMLNIVSFRPFEGNEQDIESPLDCVGVDDCMCVYNGVLC